MFKIHKTHIKRIYGKPKKTSNVCQYYFLYYILPLK